MDLQNETGARNTQERTRYEIRGKRDEFIKAFPDTADGCLDAFESFTRRFRTRAHLYLIDTDTGAIFKIRGDSAWTARVLQRSREASEIVVDWCGMDEFGNMTCFRCDDFQHGRGSPVARRKSNFKAFQNRNAHCKPKAVAA